MKRAVSFLAALIALTLTPATPAGAHRIAWGAFTSGAPDDRGAIEHFNSLVGRRAVIWHTYKNWDEDPFAGQTVRVSWESGAVPLLTWEPWGHDLRDIARGRYDGYLHDVARSGREFGKPVLLLPAHEMNGDWYPWGVAGNSPRDYKRAYRHTVRIFRREGASNVKFVWAPNVGTFSSLYPGDKWVDFLGIDGYNWGAKYDSWDSFDQVFGSSYREMVRLSHKPIIIPEFASNQYGGDKPAWIRDAFSHRLASHYPHIRAIAWFDIDKETDWRVNSSRATLSAFRSVLNQPLFDLSAEGLLRLADRGHTTALPPVDHPQPRAGDPPARSAASHGMRCRVRARRRLYVNGDWDVYVPLRCNHAARHWCTGWVRIRKAHSRRTIGVAQVDLWPGRRLGVRIGAPGWARTSLAPRRRLHVRIRMRTTRGCTGGPVRHVILHR